MDKVLLEKITEDIDKYLIEYLDKGYATYTFKLFNSKGPEVQVKTISLSEQLEVEEAIKTVDKENVPILHMHKYQLNYLSKVLLKFGNTNFSKPEDAYVFVTSKGPAIADKILQVQNTLEMAIRKELTPDEVKNFFQTPSTDIEPN